MNDEVIFTKEGFDELKKKLQNLKEVKRPEVTQRLKVAREYGDLSENAEYDAAKNEQALLEVQIAELEEKVKKAVIINSADIKTSEVSVGCRVKVYDKEYKEEITYDIVGTAEVNVKAGKISNESPVGKALLGKKVGDVVSFRAPGGMMELKVLAIN